jgi:hypothetical protein
MAKVSCQDALYYALTQARVDPGYVAQFDPATNPPGILGPFPQTVCAAPGVPQRGFYAGTSSAYDKQYAQQFGWAMQVCDPKRPAVPTDFYGYQKNYWVPADAASCIDPATLCRLPIVTQTYGGVIVVYSGLCYCSA